MIVTCPGCASKYRVRNEAVPTDGARMRCPKCNTLFLAKPPAHEDAAGPADDTSGRFQQIAPTASGVPKAAAANPFMRADSPVTGASGVPGPAGAYAGPAPGAGSQAGPVTSLFQAFDVPTPGPVPQPAARVIGTQDTGYGGAGVPAGAMPPSMPADDAPVPGVTTFGGAPINGAGALAQPLGLRAARPTLPLEDVDAPPRKPFLSEPTRAQEVGSFVALGAAGVVAAVGLVMALWNVGAVNLTGVLLPALERSFGVEPPRSAVASDGPTGDVLRLEAQKLTERGDLVAAVVAWRRAQQREPGDPRAAAAIPKLLTDVGERLGAP